LAIERINAAKRRRDCSVFDVDLRRFNADLTQMAADFSLGEAASKLKSKICVYVRQKFVVIGHVLSACIYVHLWQKMIAPRDGNPSRR
jgi:hypothetical protein